MNYLLKFTLRAFSIFTLCASFSVFASEEDFHVVEIIIKDHIFDPSEVIVPVNKKIKLVINNMDSTMEEFDSSDLKRERILRGNSKTNIILAPLAAGRYDFTGEFHEDTAKGTVIAE